MTCISVEYTPDVLVLRWCVYLVRMTCVKDAQTLALDGVVDESVRVSLKAYGILLTSGIGN